MKLRNSFVANSSSSSFICEICGETHTAWDASASDFDMVYCVHGHLMCDEHRLNGEGGKCDNDCENCSGEHCGETEIPESSCPICTFQTYSQSVMAFYLLKTTGIERNVVFEEIKKINKRRKKLYDEEYNTYVLKQAGLTDEQILGEWKAQFPSYDKFTDWLWGRNEE